MATSCEDVNARLVELLYEELPAEERAALEGHVAGCASCRAELEGFNQTRKLARQVIDDPVPRRAHAAIMSAAAAHLASAPKQEQRAAATARQGTGQRTSFWEWIRTRWTLPTLATVGAVAVFILASKVFMDPKRTYERGREIAGPEPAAAPPAAEPSPGASAPASLQEKSDHARIEVTAEEVARAKAASSHAKRGAASGSSSSRSGAGFGAGAGGAAVASKPAAASRQFAPPPPPKATAAAKSAAPRVADAKPAKGWVADDESLLAKEAPADGRKREAPRENARRDIAEESPSPAEAESDKDEGRAPRTRQTGEMGSVGGPRGGMAAPAPAPPPMPAPASAPVSRSEPEKKSVAKKKADAPAQASRPTSAPEMDSLTSSTSSKGAKAGGTTSAVAETPVQKADRLFAQGRWLAAAEAYRELLRQDPRNTDAARWRQRMTLAEARLEVEREAPASAPASAPAK